MSEFTPRGRLAQWDGTKPDLRDWSDEELIDGLGQLGIQTNPQQFAAEAAQVRLQSDIEDDWLQRLTTSDEGLHVFIWMSVQELWERWKVPNWPKDRLARMFAYLVDADFAVDWADKFHAPSASEVFDALEDYVGQPGRGLQALEEMVEMLGLPSAAWPSKMLDAMAEWAEVGNLTLARRGGDFMARMLGKGHGLAYLAAALISARMYDRATAAALEVPMDAPLDPGFDEVIGYLCLAAGAPQLGAHWIEYADKHSKIKKSEMTIAAEAVRDWLAEWRQAGKDAGAAVPDKIKGAAKQGSAQSAYYALMAFAGAGQPVG